MSDNNEEKEKWDLPMEGGWCEPSKIKVKEGLDRYRKDMGDLQKLVKSFKEVGQILPGVVNRDFELMDGGRRLAAAILAQHKYKYVFIDTVDTYVMRCLELEANLHRKDYTPAEEALAIRDLHRLKQDRLGASAAGQSGGHGTKETADIIGKSKATVIDALNYADMIDAFPQLKDAKTKGEIKKAAKGLMKLSAAMIGMQSIQQAMTDNKSPWQITHADACQHMTTIKDGTIDILLTDPIYGIDADKTCMQLGGKTGGDLSGSGYKIEDSKRSAYYFYKTLARESIRFCSASAHGYCFVGPEHFWVISRIFRKAGWRVHVKPIIWIKRETGQCNVPSAWPASCYEMCLYLRRDNSRLVKEGQPDWIECPPVDPSKKTHPFEKPVPLLINLLERVSLPGQRVYDPFTGSGATLEAAVRCKLFAVGCDISVEAYATALTRMSNLDKELKK